MHPRRCLKLSGEWHEGFRPSLVIGVPVGFVNVVEAKETLRNACLERGIPAMIAMGRKGGSSVAAAILNALIYRRQRCRSRNSGAGKNIGEAPHADGKRSECRCLQRLFRIRFRMSCAENANV